MSKLARETRLLARHSSVYALGTALQRASSLLLLPIYTRHLTPFDYGVKEMVGLSTDVIGILLATAISSAIYRFYFDYQTPSERNRVISTATIALGTAGFVVVGLLFLTTDVFADVLLNDAGLKHYFALSFASLWFQSLNSISFAYLRANQKSLQTVSLSLLRLLLMIGLNIYLVVFRELGVLGILISTLVGSAVLFAILTVPLLARVGLRFERTLLYEMIRFGLPMVPAQLGGTIVHVSDRVFLKAYTTLDEVGLYSLAYRFGTLPSEFISQPFNQTWMPRRFEIAKEPDSEQIFGRIFTWFLAFIVFVGLAISALVQDLLQVMADPKFWPAASIVPIVVLANIVFTFHYHFNIGILIEKKTKYLAWINLTNAGLVLLLNWLLIPAFGAMGAAVATLVAFAFKSGATFFVGRRFYKIHFEFIRVAKSLAVAAAVLGAVRFIHFHSVVIDLVARAVLVCVLYPVLLYLSRFFTQQELKKMRSKGLDILHRGTRRG